MMKLFVALVLGLVFASNVEAQNYYRHEPVRNAVKWVYCCQPVRTVLVRPVRHWVRCHGPVRQFVRRRRGCH
jgi:hypothetical protein